MTHVLRRALALIVPLALAVALVGCGKGKLNPLATTNLLPIVRITAAPIDTNATCNPDPARSCYSLTLDWVGFDPDGRVDHYQYAVDPPDPDQGDTTWIRTTDNEKRLVFNAPHLGPDSLLTLLRGFHTFVIAAVDNDGAVGPRTFRSFFSFTQAPTVNITNPRPSSSTPTLPPSINITWNGVDEDGVFTSKPVRYKYILLGPNQANLISQVNSSGGAVLRRLFAPDFPDSEGWTPTSGDSTSVQFSNLIPGAHYIFAVVAFDEAGAFSPVFSFQTNMLQFDVGYAAAFGPSIRLFNESFFKIYPPNYVPSPLTEARIEAPAGALLTFNWFVTPPPGASIVGIRWMLDGDVFDQTPRTNELTDTKHWSTPTTLNPGSATIGPFAGGEHFFYVDAQDNTGLRSLATVHFNAIQSTFEKQLLVVDDTRFNGDSFSPLDGHLLAPNVPWPVAAELDTFMYAVGGVPWTGKNTNSPRGILADYGTAGNIQGIPHVGEYDTLTTQIGIADIGVPLATLGHYRHVIWMTDYNGATNSASGTSPLGPTTSLRFMSQDGQLNTLGAYIRQGGAVWLMGGGGALANLIPHNVNTDDVSSAGRYVFDALAAPNELQPGRLMFDVAKWQTRINCDRADGNPKVVRFLGRYRSNPGPYALLPASLDIRTTTSDPLPPADATTVRSASQFYIRNASLEYVQADKPNDIQEDVQGDPSDFQIDAFDDAVAALIPGRWKSSDSVNTVVSQIAVSGAGSTAASGHAMQIATQGGAASAGDVVTHDLGATRDFGGILTLDFAFQQSQPTSAMQWRVRLIDDLGRSASALVTPNAAGAWSDIAIPGSAFTVDTPGISGSTTPGTPPLLHRTRKIQFVLVRGDNAGTTAIDGLRIVWLPTESTLDTLMAATANGLKLDSGDPNAQNPLPHDPVVYPTMTYYHGHDFTTPFIFSGFAPWNFQRAECKQLFDFVLQKMWDIYPSQSGGPILSRRAAVSPQLQARPWWAPATPAAPSARGVRRAVGSAAVRAAVPVKRQEGTR